MPRFEGFIFRLLPEKGRHTDGRRRCGSGGFQFINKILKKDLLPVVVRINGGAGGDREERKRGEDGVFGGQL